MCRLGTGGAPKFGGYFGSSYGDRPESSSQTIADQKSLAANAAQYHICLECALPLRFSEHGQCLKCRCMPEDIEDEWLDVGGWEIALLLGLGIACMAVSFWFCFR